MEQCGRNVRRHGPGLLGGPRRPPLRPGDPGLCPDHRGHAPRRRPLQPDRRLGPDPDRLLPVRTGKEAQGRRLRPAVPAERRHRAEAHRLLFQAHRHQSQRQLHVLGLQRAQQQPAHQLHGHGPHPDRRHLAGERPQRRAGQRSGGGQHHPPRRQRRELLHQPRRQVPAQRQADHQGADRLHQGRRRHPHRTGLRGGWRRRHLLRPLRKRLEGDASHPGPPQRHGPVQ